MKVDLPTPLETVAGIGVPQHLDLAHLAAISIAGIDAEKFLQSQLSSHITLLDSKTPQLSAWCAANGRVVALGWLFRADDAFIWFVARDSAEQVLLGLNKFKLRAKVTITQLRETVVGIFDSDAEFATKFRLPDGRALVLADQAATSDPDSGSDRAALAAQWRLRDIHQRIAWNGGHDRFLPQMLGLTRYDGLSLKKGCFPGQEVIARLHYKGELKRDLRVLTCGLPIAPGRYMCEAHNDSVEIIQSEGLLALAVVAKAMPSTFELGPENVSCLTETVRS
jgi:tRNA-modifying protein YgfZ